MANSQVPVDLHGLSGQKTISIHDHNWGNFIRWSVIKTVNKTATTISSQYLMIDNYNYVYFGFDLFVVAQANREASTIKEQKDKQIAELKSVAEQSGESAQNNFEKKVSRQTCLKFALLIMKKWPQIATFLDCIRPFSTSYNTAVFLDYRLICSALASSQCLNIHKYQQWSKECTTWTMKTLWNSKDLDRNTWIFKLIPCHTVWRLSVCNREIKTGVIVYYLLTG